MLLRPANTTYVFYFYICTVCSVQFTVPNISVFVYFINFDLLTYVTQVLSEWFCKVFVAHIIIGVTFASTFHMFWISSMRSLYFKILSAYFLIIFLSPNNATSINIHVPLLFSPIMFSSLFFGVDLPVRTSLFHNMATLTLWLVSTIHTFSYYCLLCNFNPIFF